MTVPTVADFKAFFVRDFPYGSDASTVMDADIQRGLNEAGASFNEGVFSTDSAKTTAYLYLAAHLLVMNLRASTQGLAGNYSWLEQSKGVGSVSSASMIPEQIQEHPIYAMLAKTHYGAKYLYLALPGLVGPIFTVAGGTQP